MKWLTSGRAFRLHRVIQHPLMGSGSWMMGSGIVQGVVAFMANLVLVRFLVPEEFGRFALIQANIGLVGTFFSLRVHNAMLRASQEDLDWEGRSRYFSALAVETALISVGAMALLLITELWDWRAAVLIVAVLVGLWVNAQKVLFERRFQYQTLSLLEGGSHLAGHLFAVLGVMVGLGSAVLYFRELVKSLGQITSLYHVSGLQGFRLKWMGIKDWRWIVRSIQGFWVNGVLEQSFDRLVILLVGGLVGEQATGYFFQAKRLAWTPHQLVQPVAVRVAFNYFSHHVPSNQRWSILRKVLLFEAFPMLLLGTIGIGWAETIVPALFGKKWEPVVPLLQAMGGVMIGMTPFYTIRAYCMAARLMRTFTVIGTGIQYLALAVSTGLIFWFQMPPSLMIASAVSAGFILGVIFLLFALKHRERRASARYMYQKIPLESET